MAGAKDVAMTAGERNGSAGTGELTEAQRLLASHQEALREVHLAEAELSRVRAELARAGLLASALEDLQA